jgi:uncharacterized DUF497 family protein
MLPVFDWNDENREHIAKHRVTPEEAEQVVLSNPIDLVVQESEGEERIVQVGATDKGRILLVVTTWREEMIRVVTAYPAPKQLRELYLRHTS